MNKNFYSEVGEFIEQFESGEIKNTIKILKENKFLLITYKNSHIFILMLAKIR